MKNFSLASLLVVICILSMSFADIDNLTFLGHNEQNPFHVMDVEVVGNRAYVANGLGSGLEVYDISNPANPQRIFTSGPSAWRCWAAGDTLLFVFCRRSGVTIWDIVGPGNPALLGQYNPPGNLEALEGGVLVDNILYCAAHQNGIYAIDVSNLAVPNLIDEFLVDSNATWNAVARDSFLIIANGRFGLSVVGLEGGMHDVASLPLPGLANDVNVTGNIAAVSLGNDGLATVDISDSYSPVLLDTIITEGCVWGASITDELLISGSWRVMELFDISTPYHIEKVGWDNTNTWAHGADVRDDSLIVVADWRGMSCYEIGPDPNPDIDVYPQVIDFGPANSTRDTTVIVRNTGALILNVVSIDTPAGMTANPNVFSVEPGDSVSVTVTASGSGSIYADLVYNTNDPDETSKTQEVYKNNNSFPQVGSPAPDFTLFGSDNNYHTLSDYQGKVVFLEFGGAW
ncbi:MAG: hypothetical protein WBE28_05990 [bacterium]